MIRFIPHDQIDRKKYDDCILNSRNTRIYAFSWFLDCVNTTWDLLVEGDYHMVMPLPRKVKFGIAYINSPYWIQQLGVFSSEAIHTQKVYEFLKAIPRRFFWIDYQLNAGVTLDSASMNIKKNYILSLNHDFDLILKGFNQNRRRISKKPFNEVALDKHGDIQVFLKSLRKENRDYDLDPEAIERLACLYQSNRKQVKVWNVFKGGVLIGGLLWLFDGHRITYLVPLSSEDGKQLNIATFMINELIRQFAGQDVLLDFEGSSIPGVENFYRSFGAKAEAYYYYRKRIIGHV